MYADEYQQLAARSATYTRELGAAGPAKTASELAYPVLGLTSEAGEVADKVKKLMRDTDGLITDEARAALSKELGDCLWYVSEIARRLELKLGDVMASNIKKLEERTLKGTLAGSGDDR